MMAILTTIVHRSVRGAFLVLLVFSVCFWTLGCASNSYTSKGAAQGGTTGAVAGAVGGLVSGLVFGGNPIDQAARGAVYGGTTGAVAGAMAGSQRDQQIQQSREDDREALRQKIGDEAFRGVVALAECRHEDALLHATKARDSENPNFALAGIWLEVLTYADQRNEGKARTLFPTVIEEDWDIKTEAEAEQVMRDTLNQLMQIRQEHNLPGICTG